MAVHEHQRRRNERVGVVRLWIEHPEHRFLDNYQYIGVQNGQGVFKTSSERFRNGVVGQYRWNDRRVQGLAEGRELF